MYILHIHTRVIYVFTFLYKYFPLILYTLGATADCPTFGFVLTMKGSSQDRLYLDHGRPNDVARRSVGGATDSHVTEIYRRPAISFSSSRRQIAFAHLFPRAVVVRSFGLSRRPREPSLSLPLSLVSWISIIGWPVLHLSSLAYRLFFFFFSRSYLRNYVITSIGIFIVAIYRASLVRKAEEKRSPGIVCAGIDHSLSRLCRRRRWRHLDSVRVSAVAPR